MTTTSSARGLALVRAVPLAAVGAAVAVGVVHLLFGALGADFSVAPSGQDEMTVSVGLAAGVAFGVTLVGGLLAWALSSRVRRPDRVFLVLVLVAVAVMAVNPVLAADEALTVVALELEHLVAAGVALAVLLPPLRARRH